jgi:hypothetical protein
MVSMDELAKKKSGINKTEEDEKPKDEQALNSELEKALHDEDKDLAREVQRSRAQLLIAQRRKQINQETGNVNGNDNQGTKKEGRDEYLITITSGLLEKGLEPKIVGQIVQYMMSSNTTQALPFGLPGAGMQQGLTFENFLAMMDRMKGDKGTDPALTRLIEKMDERLANVEKERNNGNKDAPRGGILRLNEQGKWIREEVNPGDTLVIPPPPPSNTGKSIDEIKEEHRHEEEMAKLNETKDYHEKITDTMSDIIPGIGRGIASSLRENGEDEGEASPPGKSKKMEYFHCTGKLPDSDKDCGYNIPVPPTALKITCPKCGTVYGRETK